ncbi:hypothetical protein Pcinc_027404 [Petrolisthes cinctipes]|uniref:Uncharacterized protein n=1 Tax=Petrolisthes cinctipes TaxID=88211 RepID=A0AAE1F444_PETCI|nr:hypothetical protein Pcinc_027404 [Petrolisthes cinctipes]
MVVSTNRHTGSWEYKKACELRVRSVQVYYQLAAVYKHLTPPPLLIRDTGGSGRYGTNMSSSESSGSTHHMLGGGSHSGGSTSRYTVIGIGHRFTHFLPNTPETHHRYPALPSNSQSRYPALPAPISNLPSYPIVTPPSPETHHRYPGYYTEGLYSGGNFHERDNYRYNFNEGSRYKTSGPSKYDPNFTLARSSPNQTKRHHHQDKREGRRNESRHMVRPKLQPDAKLDPRLLLHPPTPELPRTMVYGRDTEEKNHGDKRGKGGFYDWHLPQESLWCTHTGSMYDSSEPCKICKWKVEGMEDNSCESNQKLETLSTVSSVNPPPTFTAQDNYRPVRPRPRCRHCSCGTIFAITTLFSLLVLFLIMGFIIYIEMVLKHQTANVMDRM